jgi:secondary thiamine-phosphate synthase enzyme
VHSEEIEIRTGDRETVRDLTRYCQGFLADNDVTEGLLHVWVPHATAGLAIIETGSGSDEDLLRALRDVLPPGNDWQHRHGHRGHGRDHVLPAFLPPYATIPVLGGELTLGTWQSICLVDTNTDNPVRKVRMSLLAG